MANEAFCRAIHEIADRLFPDGFDTSPHPPNTFLELALHMAKTGRMCVSDGEPTANEFDTAHTWQAFRAIHDWCHVHGGHAFTLRGECAAVRMQLAQIGALYGPARMAEWQPILIQQIIHDNFGNEAFCPTALR